MNNTKNTQRRKFNIGDRVKATCATYHNLKGTIVQILETTSYRRRLGYLVKFDQGFKSTLYSYDLEKISSHKFNIGQRVTLTDKCIEILKSIDTRFELRDYTKTFTITGFAEDKDYKLDEITNIVFEEQDLIPYNFNLGIGERVRIISKTDQLNEEGHMGVIRRAFSKTPYTDYEIFIDDMVEPITVVVSENNLKKVNPTLQLPKFKLGQQVKLNQDGIKEVVRTNDPFLIDKLNQIFTISWYGYIDYRTGKVIYNFKSGGCGVREEYLTDEIEDKPTESSSLSEYWSDICQRYLEVFCQRHGYDTKNLYWISGPGTTIEIADMFVSMTNLRYDVDNQIPTENFEKWYWKDLEIYQLTSLHYMTYQEFCEGKPDTWPEEKLERLRQAHKRVEEAQKSLEEEIQNVKKTNRG